MNTKTTQQHKGLIGKEFKVLDHGVIKVVDTMGDDMSVVQGARVSYGSGVKTIEQDTALIKYLMRHKHTSPFEMAEIKLLIKAPIFIARQWLRHRTANVNEYSARYSVAIDQYYTPPEESISSQSTSNMQGREGDKKQNSKEVIEKYKASCDEAYKTYNTLINEDNIAREISRCVLPVSMYTEFYWKIDLHNLLHFLHLRAKPNAQEEIRKYAEIILHQIVKSWTPITYNAFMDYIYNSKTLSSNQIQELRGIMDASKLNDFINSNQENKKGDIKEFVEFLKTLK